MAPLSQWLHSQKCLDARNSILLNSHATLDMQEQHCFFFFFLSGIGWAVFNNSWTLLHMGDVDTVHMSGFISLLYTNSSALCHQHSGRKKKKRTIPTEVLPSLHQLPVNKPLIKAPTKNKSNIKSDWTGKDQNSYISKQEKFSNSVWSLRTTDDPSTVQHNGFL